MKKKRKNKGITLIALIITIIVLLILAGVSLNAIVGNNGIITNAQGAKFKSEMAKYKEDTETFIFEKETDGITNEVTR